MFVSGQSELATVIFSALTFLVAIPSGVKVFNWLTTMYKGNISLDTPMLYAMSFLFLFAIGGLTGIFLGTLATDVHLTDTYFVVAHFHYVMMGGTVIAFLGGLHYWWPKMSGRMYNEKWGASPRCLVFIGFNMTFLPQFILGSQGMPRRYYNYLDQFQPLHAFSTSGLDPGARPVHDRGLFCWLRSEARGRAGQSMGRDDARMGDVVAAGDAQFRRSAGTEHEPYDYRPGR